MIRILLLCIFLYSFSVGFGQSAPQALNYQAVARNSSGVIIPAQTINVRFTILDGAITGVTLYQETQSAITNNFGLFTLAIGKGTPTSGTFSLINWGNGDKFLKVEIAPAGDNNYQLQGTTQLLSVPYALFAEKTNLVAGPGINVNGNIISATNSGFWEAAPGGIKYDAGSVGIGRAPRSPIPLSVFMPNTGVGQAVLQLETDDTWHTGLSMLNTNGNIRYTFVVGGPSNTDVRPTNFGIFNHQTLSYILTANGSNNFVGIGADKIALIPKSRLHIFKGDINIDQIGSGIIMKSPNGQCWRITIDNSGNLVRTALGVCP